MHLYRLEVELKNGSLYTAVVVADSDEKAFEYAQNQVERVCLAMPVIQDIMLLEKKPLHKGTGYLLEQTSH